MKYYSAKGFVVIVLIVVISFFLVVTIVNYIYVIMAILFLVDAFLIWAWFDTYYMLENGQLFYKCALIKGYIAIDTITEVMRGKTHYSGVKPALATKGLIIKYNSWDDIYISPKDAEGFIRKLTGLNPNIQITG